MSEFNPQSCRVLKAEVTKFDQNSRDITPLITEVHLAQSLDEVSWKGYVVVLDNVGLLDLFPLRGEEEFRLELQCDDLGTNRSLHAQIYKIDGISPSRDAAGVAYRLNFLSKTTWEAAKRKVIRPFHNVTAGFAAEKIFRDYFGDFRDAAATNINEDKEVLAFNTKKYTLKRNDKSVYLQPTVGQIKAVIPNYTPQKALTFLANRSYSTDSVSSSFRFFETLTGFYFVTDEFLMRRGTDNPRQIKKMTHGSVASKAADEPLEQISNINTLTDTVRVDAAADMLSGGYINKSIEINLLERTVREVIHDYTQAGNYVNSDGSPRKIADDIHTEEYMKATFTEENAPRFMIFKDFRSGDDAAGVLRTDQYYAESFANKFSHSHHMKATMMDATTDGRLDIEPGSIISVSIPQLTIESAKEENDKLAGNYLVTATSHDITGTTLKTSFSMVKYG